MGTVHVGVCHDDDAVVAQLGEIDVVVQSHTYGGDHGPDGVVAQHLVRARLLYVQDLAPQRQHGLRPAVPAHLRSAAGGVALHEVELTQFGVLLRAVGQFAGQAASLHGVLADDKVSRLSRRLTRALGGQALFDDSAGVLRMVFQVVLHRLGHHAFDLVSHLGVSELGLGLSLELRVGELDPHHGG